MSLQTQWSRPDWAGAEKDVLAKLEKTHRAALIDWSAGFKADLREDVIAAGMGQKLANTWRSGVYPDAGQHTLEPSGMVFVQSGKARTGSAPKIIDFYAAARVISPVIGEALAIPTKNCPKSGRGGKRFMTPVEVEARFNAELIAKPLKSGHLGLFINVIPGVSTLRGGYRPVTGKRVAAGRKARLVLMFVLVRDVKGKKRLNHPAIAVRWMNQFAAIHARHAKVAGLD